MSLGVPKVLKDMAVYINENTYMGEVQQIVFPKITKTLEQIKTGISSVAVDLGIEPLVTTITMTEHTKEIFSSMGLLDGTTGDIITFRGSLEGSSSLLDQTSIKMLMRGTATEIDLGTFQRGSLNTYTVTYNLTHFAYYIGESGVPRILIDPITNTYMVGGVDQMLTRKKALGII